MQSEETPKVDDDQKVEAENPSPEPAVTPSEPALFAQDEQESDAGGLPDGPDVSWTASEFVSHHKNFEWYLWLFGFGGLGTALVFLVTRDIVTTVAVSIALISFGAFASRKPRTLNYRLDRSGLTIAERHFMYSEFKSFSVQEDGAIVSIFLMPLKRFMPGLTIYFPPEQEDSVVNTLSAYLPHQDREPDMMDKLMRKVRF